MKLSIIALAAATVAVGVAASSPAQARCWWDGYNTVCDRGDRVDRDWRDRDRYDRRYGERHDWRFWRHDRDRDRDYYSGGGWRDRDMRYNNWDRGY